MDWNSEIHEGNTLIIVYNKYTQAIEHIESCQRFPWKTIYINLEETIKSRNS